MTWSPYQSIYLVNYKKKIEKCTKKTKKKKNNNKLYDINEFGGSPYVQAASHKDAFICEGHFIA